MTLLKIVKIFNRREYTKATYANRYPMNKQPHKKKINLNLTMYKKGMYNMSQNYNIPALLTFFNYSSLQCFYHLIVNHFIKLILAWLLVDADFIKRCWPLCVTRASGMTQNL
jgi:hypothetical protein